MPAWFLEEEIANRIAKAYESGNVPTATEQIQYEAAILAESADGPRVLQVAGDRATVQVVGVLTDAPNLMAKWFGGGNTTYAEIRAALASADANPLVREINLFVASPGGSASAEWLATMDAVAAVRKPVHAHVGALAASAAYGIVSQANTITAQNEMTRIGSVGVAAEYEANSGSIVITSTEAPDKRPDVTTEEGKATIRTELDQMHSIFAGTVARGRGVDEKTVNEKFGRGGMMLAKEAQKRGMIDAVGASASTSPNRRLTAADSGTEGGHTMDLNKLKAEHPAVYAQIIALGVAEERDRVTAHLEMATIAEANQATALAAIKDGSPMTATLIARYTAAAVNGRDMQTRRDEDAAAAAALAAAQASTESNNSSQESTDDALAAAVAADLGLSLGAK